MADEKRATSSLRTEQPEFQSDTTGNEPIEGTRHVMQDEMQAAGAGVFAKNAGGAPSNKALSGAAGDKDAQPSLSGMTKDELIRQAALEGVQIETDDNKADIVRKIEAARG